MSNNVLTNGDFSNGLTGWKTDPAKTTLALDSSVYDGTPPSAKATKASSAPWSGLWQDQNPIKGGQTYTFSARVLVPAGLPFHVEADYYKDDWNWLGEATWDFIGTGSWQTITGIWQVPVGANTGDWGVYYWPDMPTVGTAFNLDNCIVYELPEWALGDVAERLYENLSPISGADERLGWPLRTFMDALGGMFQDGADLVQNGPDGEPGWSIILDINRVPDEGLDWLGQFIGSRFYTGITTDQKRQQIRDHVSWQRGTKASIINAIRLFLTGTQNVSIVERDSSAYHFTATILAAEAPADTSPTSPLVRYVNQFAKPAGLQWSLVVGTPPDFTYLVLYNRGDLYSDIYTNFQTYADIH